MKKPLFKLKERSSADKASLMILGCSLGIASIVGVLEGYNWFLFCYWFIMINATVFAALFPECGTEASGIRNNRLLLKLIKQNKVVKNQKGCREYKIKGYRYITISMLYNDSLQLTRKRSKLPLYANAKLLTKFKHI